MRYQIRWTKNGEEGSVVLEGPSVEAVQARLVEVIIEHKLQYEHLTAERIAEEALVAA